MKNYRQNLIVALLFIALGSYGQKLKISNGNIKNLKGIEQFDLLFDYTDLQIPKYDSEEDFLKDKMAKREEKEKGSGELFKKDWFDDREEDYHPKFIESFNKRFDDGEVKVSESENAAYLMNIHTTLMSAGYNVGVARKNAMITAEITIYSKDNPDEILFQGTYSKVQGKGAMGHDYDSGFRISECYSKLAKEFAQLILKKTK